MYKQIVYLIILLFCFFTCNPSLGTFHKYTDIPTERWDSDFIPSLEFYVQDTQSYYHLFVYIRHHNEYHFNNLWLQLLTQTKNDTALEKKEFFLADKHQWFGKSLTGNIIEHYIPLTSIPQKLPYGKNIIKIEHLMRENPLEKILTIGIRLQKVTR